MITRQKLLLISALLGAATLSMSAQAATFRVEINASRQFVPDHLQIQAGDTVEFVNGVGGVHTVTADPSLAKDANNVILPEGAAAFHSGPLAKGQSFSQTFTAPGLYQYICLPHELMGMQGQIEVVAP